MNSEDSQTELLNTPSDKKDKYKGVPYYSDHIFQQRVVERQDVDSKDPEYVNYRGKPVEVAEV